MLDYLKDLCVSLRTDGEIYTAILKPEYAVNGERVLRADAKKAYAGKWVTINGAHVLIGRNGLVIAGAGGKFNGMNFSDSVRKVHRARGIVNASIQYGKVKKELIDAKSIVNNFDKNIAQWKSIKKIRLETYGREHRLTREASRRVELWTNDRKPYAKALREVEAKVNKIKKKYPDIDKIVDERSRVKERRALQQWARQNGHDPNKPNSSLSNLFNRSTDYKRGFNGGTWTGDESDE